MWSVRDVVSLKGSGSNTRIVAVNTSSMRLDRSAKLKQVGLDMFQVILFQYGYRSTKGPKRLPPLLPGARQRQASVADYLHRTAKS